MFGWREVKLPDVSGEVRAGDQDAGEEPPSLRVRAVVERANGGHVEAAADQVEGVQGTPVDPAVFEEARYVTWGGAEARLILAMSSQLLGCNARRSSR